MNENFIYIGVVDDTHDTHTGWTSETLQKFSKLLKCDLQRVEATWKGELRRAKEKLAQAEQKAVQAKQEAAQAKIQAQEQARQQIEQERKEKERLLELLKKAGIAPNQSK